MTPSPELHQLIHSLSKKEKAWFRNWCGRNSSGTIYMQVFDAILAQRTYNEEALKKTFSGKSFLKRLPAIKNYLSEQILEALCALHTPGNMLAASSREMLAIRLLIRKGMFDKAYKRIHRLYPQLVNRELFLPALEAVALHKELLRFMNPPKIEAEMDALMKAERELLEKYTLLSAYQHIHDLFNLHQRRILHPRHKKEEDVFRKLLANPLLTSIKQAKTVETRYLFHRINASCHLMLGNLEKTMQHRKKLVALFESLHNPTSIEISKYSGVLFDLAAVYRNLGNTDEALRINKQIFALNSKYPQFRTENNKAVVFKRGALLESDLLQHSGRFSEGVQRISTWEKGIERYHALIEKDMQLILQYNIALLYYGDGKLRKALQTINSIINEHEHDYVHDVVCFARIFRLFIHIDIGNDELIGSIARSTSNYLNRRKRLYTTENLLLNFALQLAKPLTREKQHMIFANLLAQLEKLNDNRFEKAALEYFDCVSWLKAQLSGRSFAEVYQEKKLVP